LPAAVWPKVTLMEVNIDYTTASNKVTYVCNEILFFKAGFGPPVRAMVDHPDKR